MICTVTATKGGVGKSTLLINLAVELLKKKHPLFLLDSDKQGSLSKWASIRQMMDLPEISTASATGKGLVELAQLQSKNNKLVLVDTAGVDSKTTRTILLESDFVLTLSAPSPLDLWEISELLDICKGATKVRKKDLPTALVFNRVSTHSKVTSLQDAKDFLTENLIFPTYIFEANLKERISFQHSLREGKGVSEYTPKDINATHEVERLYIEFVKLISKK